MTHTSTACRARQERRQCGRHGDVHRLRRGELRRLDWPDGLPGMLGRQLLERAGGLCVLRLPPRAVLGLGRAHGVRAVRAWKILEPPPRGRHGVVRRRGRRDVRVWLRRDGLCGGAPRYLQLLTGSPLGTSPLWRA